MTIPNNSGKAIGLDKLGMVGLLVGVLCAIWTGFEIFSNKQNALPSYLFGYMFWFAITVGCVGLTLLHHTVRGAWGLAILRLLEAGGGVGTLFLLGVLAIPILANLPVLYPWARPEFTEHATTLTAFKFGFLSPSFFIARFIGYLAIWGFLANWLRKSSMQQDESNDENLAQKRTNVSAPCIVLFALTATLAFTDLTMSLDPHWLSHIWGFINIAGGALAVFALFNIIVMGNSKKEPFSSVVNRGLSKDLGNWMFVFTCLWGYFSFSQYVIIYAGNLPEFNSFFLNRQDPTWGGLGLLLMLGSFVVPFIVLLFPRVKATPKYLVAIAIWILVFRFVEQYWIVLPFFRKTLQFQPLDIGAFLAVGGLWLFAFSKTATVGKLLPTHDPRLKEAYEHA